MNIPSYSYCLGNLVSFLCNYMKLPLQSRHNLFVYDLCMNVVSIQVHQHKTERNQTTLPTKSCMCQFGTHN